MNPITSCSLQSRPLLTFAFSTSPSLLVRTRSSTAPPLLISVSLWEGSYQCIPGISWIDVEMVELGPGSVNVKLLLSVYRGYYLLDFPSHMTYSRPQPLPVFPSILTHKLSISCSLISRHLQAHQLITDTKGSSSSSPLPALLKEHVSFHSNISVTEAILPHLCNGNNFTTLQVCACLQLLFIISHIMYVCKAFKLGPLQSWLTDWSRWNLFVQLFFCWHAVFHVQVKSEWQVMCHMDKHNGNLTMETNFYKKLMDTD